jgi:hypothetical protein
MDPKTKIQKKVVELSKKLKPITDDQRQYAFDKCHDRFYVRSRKTLYCLECGHSWHNEEMLITSILGCTCPECQTVLKVREDYRPDFKDAAYFGIIATKADMQVVRMFFASKTCKKNQKAVTSIHEVMQHWIDPAGKEQTLSMSVQGLSPAYDQWVLSSTLEVRFETYKSDLRKNLGPYKIWPKRSILPIIKRNGFTGNFHGFTPQNLFSLLLRESAAETLLKTGQISLLQHLHKSSLSNVQKHWPSVKICIRNGYQVKDASIWIDYLDMLVRFGKDIHSSKFVCPVNLTAAHDRMMIKKRDQDDKLRLIKLRDQMEIDQVKYAEQKSKFFNLHFAEGEITVKVLETVEEFLNEGDQLGHCVFGGEYFKKVDSLILSARIKNKSVETIEVNLKNMSIVQSRGLKNKATEYHDRIINLVNKNVPRIAQMQKYGGITVIKI